jgi:uncharacterized protein (TIGR02996 family)
LVIRKAMEDRLEAKLLDAIREKPDDDRARLVYADWLLERGDVRGELIVLEHRERMEPEGLVDPVALTRLLEIAADHGFSQLPDDPDAGILRFHGGGSCPVQYWLEYGGREYYLRHRSGFSISVDDETVNEWDLDVEHGRWTDEECNVMLTIISDAIRRDLPLAELTFPDAAGFLAHPAHRLGPVPQYVIPEEFWPLIGRPVPELRAGPYLAARDRERWYYLWKRLKKL